MKSGPKHSPSHSIFKTVFWIIAGISLLAIGMLIFLALSRESFSSISGHSPKAKPEKAPLQAVTDVETGQSSPEATPIQSRDPFQPPAGAGTEWRKATGGAIIQSVAGSKIKSSEQPIPTVGKPRSKPKRTPIPSPTLPLASPSPDPSIGINGDAPPEEKEIPVLPGPNQSGVAYQAVYRVKAGDSVFQIARKYGVSAEVIRKANQLASIGSKLVAGTELVVPVPPDHLYRLKAGETIWRLAMRYGIPLVQLVEINQITDQSQLETGRLIILPVPVTRIRNAKY
ncbi:MAG TPA: LysM peptidoglycan-binding domain-containing protein [Bacillota bacterium]